MMGWAFRIVLASIIIYAGWSQQNPCSDWAWGWLGYECESEYVPCNPETHGNCEVE